MTPRDRWLALLHNRPADRIPTDYQATPEVTARLLADLGCPHETALWHKLNIDLAGTEGTLRDNRIWSQKLFPGQTGWNVFPTVLPDSGDVHHHPFDGEVNHFVDCIREGRESHCNVADGYRSHELCLAIDRSIAEGGRPVRLPLE